MRNLNLGKIINKTIILIVAICLFCSMAVSAAVTLDAVVTTDNATLTVSCGEAFKGKNVVVQVFEPTGQIDDLLVKDNYTQTDSKIIEEALCCVYHGKLDDNGEVSFTVAPSGPKGVYAVRISVKGIYEVTETEFVFSSDGDAAQIIAKLKKNLTDDEVAKVLKKDEDASERVYQSYQILKLFESSYYEEYCALDSEVQKAVHSNLCVSLEKAGEVTPAAFVELFNAAVIVETIDTLSGDALMLYIENNDKIIGLAERNEYKNIYKKPGEFTDDDKTALTTKLEDAVFNKKTCKDIADFFCEQILVGLLPTEDTEPGIIDEFISSYEETLKAKGADIDAYNNADKPLDICVDIAALAPFDSIEAFAEAINSCIPDEAEDDEDEDNKPSAPSPNRGGVVVSGNIGNDSNVTIPVAKPEEENQTPAQEFSDIDGVAWAQEAIITLKKDGIIAGRGDGTFAPADKVTREEFVKMLIAAVGIDTKDAQIQNFSDVTGSEWFAPYVYAAYANDIVKGIDGGFGVGQNITRQDMAVLCARALSFKGVNLEAVRDGIAFTDEISDYAKEAVAALWGAGVVNGVSETEFAPLATASRAEAAKMLYEVLKAIK